MSPCMSHLVPNQLQARSSAAEKRVSMGLKDTQARRIVWKLVHLARFAISFSSERQEGWLSRGGSGPQADGFFCLEVAVIIRRGTNSDATNELHTWYFKGFSGLRCFWDKDLAG